MQLSWKKYTLQFKNPAGTSRGILRTKDSYFLFAKKDGKTGIGECGLLKGLSVDDRPDYEVKLNWLVENVHLAHAEIFAELIEFPSIQFGYEMLLQDLESENHILFPSKFTSGESHTPINGLIWMGTKEQMLAQIKEKMFAGFKVLKLKIGAIHWQDELELLHFIRSNFSAKELELRVDANGAFTMKSAPSVLHSLAKLEVHSIEQPIKAGQIKNMAKLCAESPVPIALDEELIGIFSSAEKRALLQQIKPPFIILKPSFVGGWRGSKEWINVAKEVGAEYWVTSALESNIGLNAIAQWNFTLHNPLPSGLGTGGLYTNNFDCPLFVKNGHIGYNTQETWEVSKLLA